MAPLEDWAHDPASEGWSGLRRALRWVLWPAVPISPRRPAEHQRTPIKLTVISCLASGADQVVARAVCDVAREQAAVRNRCLEAVLPFPVELYERDFSEPDLTEFRKLMALDRGVQSTHPHPTVCFEKFPSTADPAYPSGYVTREQAYATAGRQVVDTSELIIAIWERKRFEGGVPAHSRGRGAAMGVGPA